MAETLGHVACGGVPMAIGVQTDMCTPALARFGSEALCTRVPRPGDHRRRGRLHRRLRAGAGSDVASIKTTARKDGADYVINGAKMWITNSLQADWMCLLANTSEGAAHKNKSLIMVPMNAKGVVKAKKIRKIGMMSSDTGLIHFDDVRVPQTNRIGEEGMGFTYQMMQFQEERLWAAAHAIQALLNTIQQTADYARERQIFGKSVLDHQVCHYKLAELKTEVESLRGLVYMATEKYVAGADVTEWASMAKLKACRLGRLVPTPACSTGAAWATPGTTRSRGTTATAASARSPAAPTR
jgi:citronellyl-CoA dehydrogenase